MPKSHRVKITEGPVLINTSFVDSSPQGMGAYYINEIGDPRGSVAIALQLFSSCGAAMKGASLEEVEALNVKIQAIADHYKNLALAMVGGGAGLVAPKWDANKSNPQVQVTPKKSIAEIKTLEDEEL